MEPAFPCQNIEDSLLLAQQVLDILDEPDCFPRLYPPQCQSPDQKPAKIAVGSSNKEPSCVTYKHSTDSSSVVDNRPESGEQVTQKVVPMAKRRNTRDGSSVTSLQSADAVEVKGKRLKKGNDVIKDENEKKGRAGNRKKEEKKLPEEPPTGYIHVRARRGQATDSHSLAERVRREKPAIGSTKPLFTLICTYTLLLISALADARILGLNSTSESDESPVFLWPLPSDFTFGNGTISIDPDLSLAFYFNGDNSTVSTIIEEAFRRYKAIIFKHSSGFSKLRLTRDLPYDISELSIIVHSDKEELKLGTDESYSLTVAKGDDHSIVGGAKIEANSVFGALRGLETFSQLCAYDYVTKTVQVYKAPWYIQDTPRFAYRGLLLDTSRHYMPVNIIKQIIESMSYAKLNVLHWHIIDEESFPLEVTTYPNLWKGAYTKWERYTIEDAYEIVNFAKMRGINVMPEVDVPGHAESWGAGYPDLWPSPSCREPLDVAKNFTFDVISGILTDMRKIFPFELFHLGGDEVHTDCWTSTAHVKQWLQDHNMTANEAYQYFVLKAQEIAVSKNWTPVNWEETFNTFASKLNPKTVVHNWLGGGGVCPKAVAKGFRCIFSNQGFWYLDHLDVPWDEVYNAEPLEGINDASEQQLVLGGEVCMWGETADASNVQQTIWPRAAAAAERLWSKRESTSTGNITASVLPRLQYFRCLLTRRGVQAAPVTNFYARNPPSGPGSCYEQ